MFAATTSPSYSPTWVSGQMPLTSPMAHRRSPARRYSSTGMPWGLAVTPTVSRPMPSTRGRRPVATSSRSPPHLRAVIETQDVVVTVAMSRGGTLAERQFNPVPAQGLAERLAQRCRLTGNHAAGALDDHCLAAQTAPHPGQFDACRPAAQHQQPAWDSLHARRLAGSPDSVDLDHAGAGQPARSPQQVDAPVGEPALLAGVGIVRHHDVPPS